MTDPRYTTLRDRHEALGASFTDFGGWMMPVRYGSDLAEHHAVRTAAGLFDISHMAEFWVHDGEAAGFLDYVLAGRISAMPIGKAKYSLVLAADGTIIDDVIVYRTGEQYFLVVSNAGNRDAVAEAFAAGLDAFAGPAFVASPILGESVSFRGEAPAVEDVTEDLSLIAVQGPRAEEILRATAGVDIPGLDDLGYYAWREGTFDGAWMFVARTGYTGEDGFELLVPNDVAGALWDGLLAAGEPFGIVPAGLAARDTLRLEAGMPLYGHELSRDIVPAQAGLGRVVVDAKEDFVGKGATTPAEDAPVLVGITSDGKRAGRAGYSILLGDDVVGEITSGALSPTLGHPIAMAFVSPSAAELGTELSIDVRGTRIPATVTALPFYRRNK
ncbi:glycine cleavage system aminomethyltransferase GcvT [Microbacterium candidum]|uniref:Aminomethyltransferase n=1 Tax=Microbacterium candidum TaxID=3041922 RepID=A0ABT7N2E5_9MICO|nr:glycine cleavage system aminomethyltransferase GcvT [Microbacterium sp. ASV49]MDL9980835.1 glycine cleavage system aminomethyltransferase GcvT [Microbacterium sp. ASV49]